MRVYASSLTEEQRTASGAAGVAGTDREGFDAVVLSTVRQIATRTPAPVTDAVRCSPALRAQEIDMRDEAVSLSFIVLLIVAAYNPPLDFKTRHCTIVQVA
jgi:hypothetical protein